MRTRLPAPEAIDIPPIDRDPNYKALLDQQAAIEKRIAAAVARRQRARALQRGAPAGRSPLARALDLARGAVIPSTDPAAEIAAAENEEHTLRRGLIELTAQIRALRSELTVVQARKVKTAHDDALRTAWLALETMTSAFEVAAGIRARMVQAGYDLTELLPAGMPPASLVLSTTNTSSQAWQWRRYVEQYVPF